jgi:hypothetical protein
MKDLLLYLNIFVEQITASGPTSTEVVRTPLSPSWKGAILQVKGLFCLLFCIIDSSVNIKFTFVRMVRFYYKFAVNRFS